MINSNRSGAWAPARLSDVAGVVRRRVKPQDHPELPFIGMDNIEAHTMRLLGTVPSTTMKSASVHFRPGDVLYGRLRPYLNKVIVTDFEGLASAEFIPLTTPEGVAPKFIQYRLNAADFVSYASHLDEGDRPRVDCDQIGAFALDVPPSGEQRRIVDAIESYFTRLDDAVATLERVQRNLKRYRASVLKDAVEGRLVPTEAEMARAEGRDYESASFLLDRILAERRRRWEESELAKMKTKGKTPKDDKWKAKYREPVAPDTADLPELPAGWCWVRAEQVCDFITKGTTPRADLMRQGVGDVPYIKVYNRTFDGSLNFSVNPTFVGTETHRGFLVRSLVRPGDVLANIVGPPLGKVSIVPSTHQEWNINQAIARFRPLDGLMGSYLALVLGSLSFLEWAKQRSKATAGQFNLTLEICRDTPVPLPPAQEQARIAEQAERASALVAEVGKSSPLNSARCSRLRQAVLQWAFEGRLVDQNPTDEPATVLLERIRAERESSDSKPPQSRGRRKARASTA